MLSLLADVWYFRYMATLTIRNLDEKAKRRLQIRAVHNGRSMEAEARAVLEAVTEEASSSSEIDIGTAIHNRFAKYGGVELYIPKRQRSPRDIPTFE